MKASILYIGDKLSKHGYAKSVIETLGLKLENEGYRLFYAGTILNPILRMIEILYTIFVRRKLVDFVLIDTYSTSAFWYSFFSAFSCRLLNLRYVHILHGGNLPNRIKNSKPWCDKIFPFSYRNIAVSEYLKSAFNNAGYSCIVIPNSIEIEFYRFMKRSHFKPNILWVRSFHQQYNPNMAADVLMALLHDYPDATLCMVGSDNDGSMQKFKIYIENMKIQNHIKITGLLNRETWIRLADEFDFFINTTFIDNTPISIIEAMALGIPVISTNVGGIPFLISDSIDGFLVPSNNAKEMAERIIMLLNNNNLAIACSNAARIKAENFSWEIIKYKWFELFAL